MAPDHHASGASGEERRDVPLPARLWAALVDGSAALGTVMIGVLMLLISADILARNIVGGSLPLISELGALTLVMIVYLQLGTTIRHNRLARIEFFLVWLEQRSPRALALVNGLWELAGVAVCAAIAWSTLGIFRRDVSHMEFIGVPGVMTLPTWPFRALILIGVTIAVVQFALRAIAEFRRAAAGGVGAP
jgi:TRAP-type mannitol/chloroaromatic compound transport system permease small subunit